MSKDELLQMLLGDFFLKCEYYNREKEAQQQFYANLIRLQTVELINIQLPEKSKFKEATKLWRFPWDEQKDLAVKEVTPERQKEQIDRLLKAVEQLNG